MSAGGYGYPHIGLVNYSHALAEYLDMPHLTEPILTEFASPIAPPGTWMIALSDPRTPAGVILEMAERTLAENNSDPIAEETKMRRLSLIAQHPHTPPTILAALNLTGDSEVRKAITLNHRCPALILAAMASDMDWQVRYGVASNPATPLPILLEMRKDSDSAVTDAVLSNAALPVEILVEILGPVPDLPRIHAASRNPSIGPERISEWLRKHPWMSLKRVLAAHPKLPSDEMENLLSTGDTIVQSRLAANPSLPANLADELARPYLQESVRESLARNVTIRAELAGTLLVDPSEAVREAAATNPTLDSEKLAQALADEESFKVQNNILAHPNLSDEAILAYLGKAQGAEGMQALLFGGTEEFIASRETLSPDLFAVLSRTSGKFVLSKILRKPECPASIIEQYLNDPEPYVRGGIVANPAISHEILHKFASDPDATVRFIACAHPKATEEMRVLSFLTA